MDILCLVIGFIFGSIFTTVAFFLYMRYKMQKMMKSIPNLGDIFCAEDEE